MIKSIIKALLSGTLVIMLSDTFGFGREASCASACYIWGRSVFASLEVRNEHRFPPRDYMTSCLVTLYSISFQCPASERSA